MNELLKEVLAGELSRPAPRRLGRRTQLPARLLTLHADERGMLSLVSMVTMLFFLVLVAMVTNIGRAINLKIDAQNVADAAAYSASVEMARGMNAVTATNHLMGEMLSFVVVHRAIGGPELEKGTDVADQDTYGLKAVALEYKIGLPIAKDLADVALDVGGGSEFKPFAYDKGLSDDIKTGATTRDGKIRLKLGLEIVYGMKAAAGALMALKPVPYVGPVLYAIGTALAAVAHAMEFLILAEWKVLDLMEKVAKNKAVLKFRDVFYTWLLPNAFSYMKFIAATGGTQAGRGALAIAEMNGFECSTLKPLMTLSLPIKPENYPGSKGAKKERTGPLAYMDPGLAVGTEPGADKLQSKEKTKQDQQNQTTAGAAGDSNTQDQTDDGEGDFKVYSLFSEFPIPTYQYFYKDFFSFNTEDGFVLQNPGELPTYRPFKSSKWEYGTDGLYWTQCCMATFPWVCYDRKPIMLFASWMVVSNTTGLFRYYTNAYCIERGQYLCTRKKKPALFFVLKGSSSTFKGVECFTGWAPPPGAINPKQRMAKAAKQAKSFFTVRAFVQRPAEAPFSKSFFLTQSPEVGNMAYARAMFYNAGEYSGGGDSSSFFGTIAKSYLSTFTDEMKPPHQGGIPYDTLNWEDPSDSNNARRWSGMCKYGALFWPLGFDATLTDGCPKIKLQWQAKLVPTEVSVTDTVMARMLFPAQLSKPMARAFPLPKGLDLDPDKLSELTDELKPVKDILQNH